MRSSIKLGQGCITSRNQAQGSLSQCRTSVTSITSKQSIKNNKNIIQPVLKSTGRASFSKGRKDLDNSSNQTNGL